MRDIERRSFMQGVASVAMLGGFGAAGMAPAAFGQTALEASSLRSNAKSFLWGAEDFAQGTGLFTGAGLKLSLAATNRGVNQDALIGGAADILLGAPTQNMRVQIRRQPVKMICGWVNKFASNVVIRKAVADKAGVTEASAPVQKAAALRGLKIGTTGPGGGPDQLARYLMRMAKIDPATDAELVPIQGGGAAILAAYERGTIDGFVLSSPTSDVAISKFGAVYLFNMVTNPPPELEDYLYITASVSEKTAKEKPAELTAYCKGIALALRGISGDPAGFKDWAKTHFGDMDPALFETAFSNNIGMYMKTPVPSRKQFDLNLEFLDAELKQLAQPGIPAGFRFEDAYDLSFAEKAMASL